MMKEIRGRGSPFPVDRSTTLPHAGTPTLPRAPVTYCISLRLLGFEDEPRVRGI